MRAYHVPVQPQSPGTCGTALYFLDLVPSSIRPSAPGTVPCRVSRATKNTMRAISATLLFGRLRHHDSMGMRVARACSATEAEGGEHRAKHLRAGCDPPTASRIKASDRHTSAWVRHSMRTHASRPSSNALIPDLQAAALSEGLTAKDTPEKLSRASHASTPQNVRGVTLSRTVRANLAWDGMWVTLQECIHATFLASVRALFRPGWVL